MASSVSSERAFSAAGITISKRRSRLKADIVEALQFLKCLYRRDLIFREEPSISSELDMEAATQGQADESAEGVVHVDSGGWDDLVGGDLGEDDAFQDFDDVDVFVQTIT
jgi:hypothetical protein